ncbi:MAG TPA: hypothetical protein VEI49_05765 [Terriglobales bacterium]|nr:hypothetical protein [Terriglobales bacterium]
MVRKTSSAKGLAASTTHLGVSLTNRDSTVSAVIGRWLRAWMAIYVGQAAYCD